jgi:hypothetical protein
LTTARVTTIAVALCAGLLSRPVRAQDDVRPQLRPYELFGQRRRAPHSPDTIDFTMALNNGFDDSSTTDSDALPFGPMATYSNLESSLRYRRERRDRRLTIDLADAFRYYPTASGLVTANYDLGAAYSSPLWRRSRISANQHVAYTPYYEFNALTTLSPALAFENAATRPASSTDYAIGRQPALTLDSGAQFAQEIGRQSTLTLAYDRRSVLFPGASGRDFVAEGAQIRYSRRVSRFVGFHAGAGTRIGTYGSSRDAARVQTRDIDIGLDYDRPLSLSRRTTFTFSTGSSLVPEHGATHYRLNGSATLTHAIGRNWSTSAQYSRGVQFIDPLPEPFLSDSISARLHGAASRRVTVTVSAGYANGTIGSGASIGTLATYTATGELGIAINRHTALSADYVRYYYRLDGATAVAGFPPRLDRQTARIGLKMWLPVLH